MPDSPDSPARPRAASAGAARLPVLDLRDYTAPDGRADRRDFLDALRAACRDPGFLQLTGHGVPSGLTERIIAVSRAFFDLPLAAKLEIENVHSPHFRGYTRLGHEITRGRPDLREQIDISDERPARVLGPDDPPYLRLDGPNQWPAALPELRVAALAYLAELGRVARVLVRALAESLGLPPDHLDPTFSAEPRSHLKLLRYLPTPAGSTTGHDAAGHDATGHDAAEPNAAADGQNVDQGIGQGVGAHKDGGFLTFVLQDGVRSARQDGAHPDPRSPTGPSGLQVADGAGGWIEAAAVPGAFVVNIGEMFELATRRYYRATVHRVVSPPPGHERVSVAFFFGPRLSATLEPMPLPDALLAEIPDAEPPDPENPIFAQHGTNTLKSWLRSHPEVARRHYADVAPPAGVAPAAGGGA